MLAAIFNRLIPDKKKPVGIFANMSANRQYAKEATTGQAPIFITGVGRSGTHFMAALYEAHEGVQSWHLDDVGDAVGDAFEWYSRWYGWPVDHSGFLNSRGFLMEKSAQTDGRFIESNPMIALSVGQLIQSFGGKAVIMVRHPRKVVESHYRKGWYEDVPPFSEQMLGYGYHHQRPNHYFSRIMPVQPDERRAWYELPRLGKIAWMWRATYEHIFAQLARLDASQYKLVRTEDVNHESLIELNKWLGIQQNITRQQFERILAKKPGKSSDSPIPWRDTDKRAFDTEISKTLPWFHGFINTENWLFQS